MQRHLHGRGMSIEEERRRNPPAWHAVAERIRVLAPEGGSPGLAAFLDRTRDSRGEPFAPARIESLGRLSTAILTDPVLRQDPASVSVAYWLRRAQLTRLAEEHARRAEAEPDVIRVPVGRVLHLAPANVDTLFIYSWALAFLCGNASVVRVSQDAGLIVQSLLRVIGGLAREDTEFQAANRFVTYGHDEALTGALSAWCTHRVIWGGDDTVAALRPLPLPPHASERVFGNKYSFAVIDAGRYVGAAAEERARVAGGFFNDLFWFDQMACSSPQVVFWLGDPEMGERAAGEFEHALQVEVERRRFHAPVSSAVHRRNYAFGVAASSDVRVVMEHPGFVSLRVRDGGIVEKEICGGGLFRHVVVRGLSEVLPFVDEGDQTLTHWGVALDELRAFAAEAGARGLDRIVPIGEALAFDFVWDGFNLIDDVLRRVRVRGP